MTVVSDTSPLNYLILIGEGGLLSKLYGRVLIPPTVREELSAPDAPSEVRGWITNHPDGLEVSSESFMVEGGLDHLHAGERDAISLALGAHAEALIIDERRGREEAEARRLKVIGTVGVLAAAYEGGLLDLADAFERLRQTTFHVSPKLLAAILRKYEA